MKILDKRWFIITMMFFVPPFGIYLLWRLKSGKKNVKILLTIPLAFWSLVFLSAIFSPPSSETVSQKSDDISTTITESQSTTIPISSQKDEAVKPADSTTNNLEAEKTIIESPKQEEEEPVVESTEQIKPDTSTVGQKNALKKAITYLTVSAFSYDGLVKQLEFEGFTNEESTYAADNCGADWNEQASKKAITYLSTTAFSYDGLVKQLEYEGFTNEQSTYGVDTCNADWNEQAAKKAKSYLDFSSFSKQSLIQQLEYEGFTNSQANYGATQNGF